MPEIHFDCSAPEIICHINRNLPFAVIYGMDNTVAYTFVEYESQAVLRRMLSNAYRKDAIDGAANFLNKIRRNERKIRITQFFMCLEILIGFMMF